MRLLIIGDGKMGQAIDALARAAGHTVVAILDADTNRDARAVAGYAGAVDVAIEFTDATAVVANVTAAIDAGIPVVVGTTGWYEQRDAVETRARETRGAVLIAPNFSLGVALAAEVMRRAGAIFASHPHFGVAMVETHHAAKKDAPSGTAAALASAVQETHGTTVPITSVRVGSVPGTHTLIFDGPFEQIAITHEARDRRVFADGALRAALWLVGRTGVFTMRDVISEDAR